MVSPTGDTAYPPGCAAAEWRVSQPGGGGVSLSGGIFRNKWGVSPMAADPPPGCGRRTQGNDSREVEAFIYTGQNGGRGCFRPLPAQIGAAVSSSRPGGIFPDKSFLRPVSRLCVASAPVKRSSAPGRRERAFPIFGQSLINHSK